MRITKPVVIFEENRDLLYFGVRYLCNIKKAEEVFTQIDNFVSATNMIAMKPMQDIINKLDELDKRMSNNKKLKRVTSLLRPRYLYKNATNDLIERGQQMTKAFVDKLPFNAKMKKLSRTKKKKQVTTNVGKAVQLIITYGAIPHDKNLENGVFHEGVSS